MSTVRIRNIATRIVVPVVAIVAAIVLSALPGSSGATVHPSFDPSVHVELQYDGLHVTWVTDTDEPGYVELVSEPGRP